MYVSHFHIHVELSYALNKIALIVCSNIRAFSAAWYKRKGMRFW